MYGEGGSYRYTNLINMDWHFFDLTLYSIQGVQIKIPTADIASRNLRIFSVHVCSKRD